MRPHRDGRASVTHASLVHQSGPALAGPLSHARGILDASSPYSHTSRMDQRIYTRLTGTIFLIIAVLHLIRIVYRWNAVIASWSLPMGLSWVALVVAGYLAWWGLSKK